MTQQRRRRPSGPRNPRNNTPRNNGRGGGGGDPRRNFEKYNELARAAEASGDHVARELYFQHADHYYRVMNERSQNTPVVDAEPTGSQPES